MTNSTNPTPQGREAVLAPSDLLRAELIELFATERCVSCCGNEHLADYVMNRIAAAGAAEPAEARTKWPFNPRYGEDWKDAAEAPKAVARVSFNHDAAPEIEWLIEPENLMIDRGETFATLYSSPTASASESKAAGAPVAGAETRQPHPDDMLTVAHIDAESGAGTLILDATQLGDFLGFVGEEEETYTVRIAGMKRAEFEALAEIDGF